jgi:hypothetical protein
MIGFDQLWGMHLAGRFPCVVAFGISLPLEEVLELSRLSMTSVTVDLLHLIFLFALNEVRWWLGKVRAMCSCFTIGQ